MNTELNFMHLAERSAPQPEHTDVPEDIELVTIFIGGREAVTLLVEQFNKL